MSNLEHKLHIFEITTLNIKLIKDSVLSCVTKNYYENIKCNQTPNNETNNY